MAFIVFEGIDGCGKSTQIKLLADFLKSKNIGFILTREPGGTPLGEEVRKLLLRTNGEDVPHPRAELLLYEAIRAQHVEVVIKPAMNQKKWVISDRFSASTTAFQSAGRNLKLNDIKWLNAYATDGIKPELTILIDISVSECQKRLSQRNLSTGHDRFEQEEQEFHEKVRLSYLAQAEEDSKGWIVIDGTTSVSQIHQQIIDDLIHRNWTTH
ncbi:MAG: dTMP kinase [Pseudomonadota bacterium]|nr:dTMP kinase [Pseudomonadota bacterium]